MNQVHSRNIAGYLPNSLYWNLCVLSACVALSMQISSARADTLVDWTFDTSKPTTAGPFAPEVNNTSFTAAAAAVTNGTKSSPAGNGSTNSYSSNGWVTGNYFQFTLNASNYTGLSITFDQMSSNTGPAHFAIQYSLDGSTFTNLSGATYSVTNDGWSPSGTPNPASTRTFDFSGIAGLNGDATVAFRVVDQDTVSVGGGTVASTGTDRVDNFIVSGTAMGAAAPEPATVFGGILSLAALGWNQRRRLGGLVGSLRKASAA